MTPEQKQRIEQIELARKSGVLPWSHLSSPTQINNCAASAIDFLLSLVKSQESEHGYWPALLDRGDGVRDHFCIGRLIRPGEIYWEFWNKGRWVSAGEVFVGREAAQKQLDAIRANDVASMRSACVEIADRYTKDVPESVDITLDRNGFAAGYLCAAGGIKKALESLSIEQPKE